MRNHSRRGRTCLLIASILVAAPFAAPAHSGEIFKCVAKDGTALYQNFPCEIESLGFLPSNPSQAKAAAIPARSGSAAPKPVVAAPAPSGAAVSVASTAAANPGLPRVGMSSDEVRAKFGEPEEMVEDEPAVGGLVSAWRYADGKLVHFDHKHLVVEVQH